MSGMFGRHEGRRPTPKSAGARMARTCGSSPRPTKLKKRMSDTSAQTEIPETYIVETPASIAEDRVSAVKDRHQRTCRRARKLGYAQHCKPIRNANKMTGAVYCPSVLYDGCVYRRYRYAKSEQSKPTAYPPHVRAAVVLVSLGTCTETKERRTHADQLVVDESVNTTICEKTPSILCCLQVRLAVQRNLNVGISVGAGKPESKDNGEAIYLLKYCTMPSMQPMKHSAQSARHASTARKPCMSAHDLHLRMYSAYDVHPRWHCSLRRSRAVG